MSDGHFESLENGSGLRDQRTLLLLAIVLLIVECPKRILIFGQREHFTLICILPYAAGHRLRCRIFALLNGLARILCRVCGHLHVKDGPMNAGQRDWHQAVLILIGYACLFMARRNRRAWWMIVFGLSLGLAGTIKPTAVPLGILLLAFSSWDAYKKHEPYVALSSGAVWLA